MSKLEWALVALSPALMLVGGDASAGERLQTKTPSAAYSITIQLSDPVATPTKTESRAAPVLKFAAIPRTVRLVGSGETSLASSSSSGFSQSLELGTNGRSTCLRVLGQKGSSGAQVPLSFSIMRRGETVDPCTGKPPSPDSIVDPGSSQPVAWKHKYWKYKKGTGWILVTCDHADGIG
jgi:hypothetical protein